MIDLGLLALKYDYAVTVILVLQMYVVYAHIPTHSGLDFPI